MSADNSCLEIPGYKPDPSYPHIIKDIDRWSASRPFDCGTDKICLSKPSLWKEVVLYIGVAFFFAGAVAVMILMIIFNSQSENKIV